MVRWLRQQEILFTLLNPKFSITAWERADPRITFLLSHQVCRRRSRDSHIKRVDSFRMWWAGHFHRTATNTRNTGIDTFHFCGCIKYISPARDTRNPEIFIHLQSLEGHCFECFGYIFTIVGSSFLYLALFSSIYRYSLGPCFSIAPSLVSVSG